jgi:DNA ligase-associated metallophosphoesterase
MSGRASQPRGEPGQLSGPTSSAGAPRVHLAGAGRTPIDGTLDPDGAWVDETHRVGFVADLHLGKGTAFRRAGVAVPEGGTEADLERLSCLVDRHGLDELWVLGDLVHAPASRSPELDRRMRAWRARHPEVRLHLVRGNHDRRSGDPPREWGFAVHDAPAECHGLMLLHEPPWAGGPELGERVPALAGHLHPVLRVRSGRGPGLRARAFWWHAGVLVLPAFGTFTGGARIDPSPSDRLFAVGPDTVVELPVR